MKLYIPAGAKPEANEWEQPLPLLVNDIERITKNREGLSDEGVVTTLFNTSKTRATPETVKQIRLALLSSRDRERSPWYIESNIEGIIAYHWVEWATRRGIEGIVWRIESLDDLSEATVFKPDSLLTGVPLLLLYHSYAGLYKPEGYQAETEGQFPEAVPFRFVYAPQPELAQEEEQQGEPMTQKERDRLVHLLAALGKILDGVEDVLLRIEEEYPGLLENKMYTSLYHHTKEAVDSAKGLADYIGTATEENWKEGSEQ